MEQVCDSINFIFPGAVYLGESQIIKVLIIVYNIASLFDGFSGCITQVRKCATPTKNVANEVLMTIQGIYR